METENRPFESATVQARGNDNARTKLHEEGIKIRMNSGKSCQCSVHRACSCLLPGKVEVQIQREIISPVVLC